MTKQIEVRFLPAESPSGLADACVIMTDVLRASSTIATALANGAARILPQAGIDESRALADKLGPEARIGGERQGKIIAGFDLGNSPLEYQPDAIDQRTIVLCTTNGTWAIEYCRGAKKILIGALVNLGAVAEVAGDHERVVVVCAGTNRKITGEDVLFGGALTASLLQLHPRANCDRNALVALGLWRDVCRSKPGPDLLNWTPAGSPSASSIFDYFKSSRGGRNLFRMNYVDDLSYCAAVDSVPVVPFLDEANWEIRTDSPR